MIDLLLGILIVGALIAAIFGQKTAQSFVRLCVGVMFALVLGLVYFFYKLDQIGGHTAYPGQVPAQQAPAIFTPPTGSGGAQQQLAPQQQAAIWVPCSICAGTGQVTCPVCHGTGQDQTISHEYGPDGAPPPADLGCSTCFGSGKVQCSVCGGLGGHYESR
jgi:DnaJ-class molecular chaperone